MTNFSTRASCRMVSVYIARQRRDRDRRAGRDRMRCACSRPSTKGSAAAPIGAKNFALLVFRDVAGRDQPRHRHRRVGDAAEPVGEAEIVHAHVAGVEARMDMNERAGLVGRLPERIEVGGSSVEPTPRGSVPIMAPGKPAFIASLSTAAARAPSPQRHGRQRHETRLGFGGAPAGVVGEPRPGLALGARQLIAEHVDPAADHLLVDALLRPSRRARAGISRQRLRHRPRRLAAGKGEARGCRRPRSAARWETSPPPCGSRPAGRAAPDGRGNRRSFVSFLRAPRRSCRRASETLIGSVLMEMPSGLSASLTALAIAAGAPR